MNQRTRVRRVGLLCCHMVRNVAYYQAGRPNGELVSQEDFWCNANSNFLDIAVLEWCKLFGEWNGKHHWRKVVPEPTEFPTALHEGIGITQAEFDAHKSEMKDYRDKFVAHLDSECRMQIPRLTIAVDSTIFLFTLLRTEFEEFLPDAPQNLRQFYEQRIDYGRRFYPKAP